MKEGNIEVGVKSLRKSLKMHGSARGYVMGGKLAVGAGRHEEALLAFRCALQVEPATDEARQVIERLLSISAK